MVVMVSGVSSLFIEIAKPNHNHLTVCILFSLSNPESSWTLHHKRHCLHLTVPHPLTAPSGRGWSHQALHSHGRSESDWSWIDLAIGRWIDAGVRGAGYGFAVYLYGQSRGTVLISCCVPLDGYVVAGIEDALCTEA